MNSAPNHTEANLDSQERLRTDEVSGRIATFRGSLRKLMHLYESRQSQLRTMLAAAGLNIDPGQDLETSAEAAFLALKPRAQGTVQERMNRMIKHATDEIANTLKSTSSL